MNERIKEIWQLAADASAAYPSGQNNSWETQVNFMEKFAELIVRECIEVASKARSLEASAMITMHFGIGRQGWVCPTCGVDRTKDICPKGHSAVLFGACPMIGEAQ